MIGPGDDASVRWLAEIDAGRVTGIVQRIVRAPSFQTERFPDATHTVQDEVRIVVDRRLLPGQDHAAAFADIARAIGTVPPCEVAVEIGPVNRPAEVALDSPVVKLLEDGLRAAGVTPRHSYSQGCVDAGFFVERGIPAVMFGAGDPKLWHTDEELVSVADVLTCARALAHATVRHLTHSRPS